MKKLIIAFFSLIILTKGVYQVYDYELVKMIQNGKISDNGYGYNYLPEMVKVALKEKVSNK